MAEMTVLPVLRTTARGSTNHAGMARSTEMVVSEAIAFTPGVPVARYSTARIAHADVRRAGMSTRSRFLWWLGNWCVLARLTDL